MLELIYTKLPIILVATLQTKCLMIVVVRLLLEDDEEEVPPPAALL